MWRNPNSDNITCIYICVFISFPDGSAGKEFLLPAGDARDPGSITGSRRHSEEGNGNPFQYSCLGKFHGQRSLVGYSPGVCKESDTADQASKQTFTYKC